LKKGDREGLKYSSEVRTLTSIITNKVAILT
jgi:hypothetical protein